MYWISEKTRASRKGEEISFEIDAIPNKEVLTEILNPRRVSSVQETLESFSHGEVPALVVPSTSSVVQRRQVLQRPIRCGWRDLVRCLLREMRDVERPDLRGRLEEVMEGRRGEIGRGELDELEPRKSKEG